MGAKDGPSQAFVVPSSALCDLWRSQCLTPAVSAYCMQEVSQAKELTVSWGNPLAGGQVAERRLPLLLGGEGDFFSLVLI